MFHFFSQYYYMRVFSKPKKLTIHKFKQCHTDQSLHIPCIGIQNDICKKDLAAVKIITNNSVHLVSFK